MHAPSVLRVVAFTGALLVPLAAVAQPGAGVIELKVKPGTPLEIRIDAKTPFRKGTPVHGMLSHPVHVFDREVLPVGTVMVGSVEEVLLAPKSERIRSYLSGRFRTRREALVAFREAILVDGRRLSLSTSVTLGVPAVIRVAAGGTAASEKKKEGAIQVAKERAKAAFVNHEAVRAVRDARNRDAAELISLAARKIGAALKVEALSYWPFGAQYLNRGATFSAVLTGQPLDFGTVPIDPARLERIGSIRPPPDTIVHARLLHKISSATAIAGMPIRVVTTRPVFSAEGDLVLPEGSEIIGEVANATAARRFGRNGRLQLRFTRIEALDASGMARVNGSLEAVEADSRLGARIDAEGQASIPVSKKRFIAPAIAATLATNSVPDGDDAIKVQGGAPGWSGFGLAGTAASLATHTVAGPLAWWGVAHSTYYNLIRKADEMEFPANTRIEIKFGRSPVAAERVATEVAAGVTAGLR